MINVAMSQVLFLTLILFIVSSITYVYLFRGQERYAGFSEYVRKGWPIFTPLNCLLYIFTKSKAQKAIMDVADFKELKKIEDNWETIREEALSLYKQGSFDQITDPKQKSFYDVGFRTFYKYGWSKFYLKWYGYTHNSAKKLCPKTLEILKDVKIVNGAMFSILPPGSQLTRHLDPTAVSLRYHLGLATPNSNDCFINVDGTSYSWRDGQSFMFDETYLHFAQNNSQQYRLILMCDIERPMSIFGKIVNFFYKFFMMMTVVPNTDEDRRGLLNKIFASLSPVFTKTKALKQTNKKLYLLVKHSTNFTLLLIVAGLIYGAIQLVSLFLG